MLSWTVKIINFLVSIKGKYIGIYNTLEESIIVKETKLKEIEYNKLKKYYQFLLSEIILMNV